MNNKEFLIQMQNLYESLKYFSIEDDKLILNKDGEYKIPFTNITLSNLNPNLFLLDPKEIFHILYVLELLPKEKLTETEITFINQYVTRYLKLNDMALTESNLDTNLIWCLNIPIFLAYDEQYYNTHCSSIIQNTINSHNEQFEKSENGKEKQKRLVLVPSDNPNFIQEIPEDNIHTFEKAGFTTLLLIASSVVATCLYIANFIIGN